VPDTVNDADEPNATNVPIGMYRGVLLEADFVFVNEPLFNTVVETSPTWARKPRREGASLERWRPWRGHDMIYFYTVTFILKKE
jgi:hypothetical protein